MKAADWIDRAKKMHGWASDYKAAQELGLSRNAISNYRGGLRLTFDEDTSIKVAEALGERPEAVLLDQYAERTKTPAVRTALLDAARRLCILCKVPHAMELIATCARVQGLSADFCA